MKVSREHTKVLLFALGMLVLLVGFVILYLGFDNFAARSLGLLLCVGSTYLINNARRGVAAMAEGKKRSRRATTTRPGRVAQILSVLALAALGLSFFFLYKDALNGYHEVWPVYVFGAAVVVCAVVWPYVIAKLM